MATDKTAEEGVPEGESAPDAERRAAAVPIANPYLSAVLALIFPGAGHFFLGRRARALAFAAIVLTALVVGVQHHGNLYRVVPNQPLTFLATMACMGMGIPYWVLRSGLHYQGDILAAGYEYGTAFVLTAGLMNLLLALDAWDVASGRKD